MICLPYGVSKYSIGFQIPNDKLRISQAFLVGKFLEQAWADSDRLYTYFVEIWYTLLETIFNARHAGNPDMNMGYYLECWLSKLPSPGFLPIYILLKIMIILLEHILEKSVRFGVHASNAKSLMGKCNKEKHNDMAN